MAMMSAALSVARVLENLADLLLGVAISPARDVGAIDEYHDDFIRIAPGHAVIAKPAAQLVGHALGHRRLANADAAIKEKAFQRASLHMFLPLVADDGGELPEYFPIARAKQFALGTAQIIACFGSGERSEFVAQTLKCV